MQGAGENGTIDLQIKKKGGYIYEYILRRKWKRKGNNAE